MRVADAHTNSITDADACCHSDSKTDSNTAAAADTVSAPNALATISLSSVGEVVSLPYRGVAEDQGRRQGLG